MLPDQSVRTNMPTIRACILAAVFAIGLAFHPCGYAAENIVESTEVSPTLTTKVESFLMVGTSALSADPVLGNKQALIGAELRKLLKGAGIQVFPAGIKLGEKDPKAFVSEAIAKNNPSHVLTVTIPSGVVLAKRSTGETVSAKNYVVRAEVVEAKLGTVVWTYSGEVSAGFLFGASNAQVAESIFGKLRADGCI